MSSNRLIMQVGSDPTCLTPVTAHVDSSRRIDQSGPQSGANPIGVASELVAQPGRQTSRYTQEYMRYMRYMRGRFGFNVLDACRGSRVS